MARMRNRDVRPTPRPTTIGFGDGDEEDGEEGSDGVEGVEELEDGDADGVEVGLVFGTMEVKTVVGVAVPPGLMLGVGLPFSGVTAGGLFVVPP